MIQHFVARTRWPSAPLCDPDHAPALWRSLRRCFPRALCAVLMPNHLHVVLRVVDADRARRSLGGACAGFSRRLSVARGWEPVPPPTPVRTVGIARRTVRYVLLNPCRAGLVQDPLEWPWTTHRDLVGAVASPWMGAGELAAALDLPRRDLVARLHRFIARDACVAAGAERLPQPYRPGHDTALSLHDAARAAASAMRGRPSDVQRRGAVRHLFVVLARRHARVSSSEFAEICVLTRRAVEQLAQRPLAPDVLAAGLRCAGDERLRAWRSPACRAH